MPSHADAAPKTRAIGTRHQIADDNIRRLQQAGQDRHGDPAHFQDKIDQWLDYRLGPDDEMRL